MKEKFTLTFLLLLIAIFSVITNVNASTEDDGWVEGDYEGSLAEQEKQAQEDWEDAGRPGDEEDNNNNDNDNENDEFAGLPTPEEAGETGVVDCGNGVFVEPREPCPEEENDEDYTSVTCWNGEEVSELSDCPDDDGSVTCPDGITEVIRLSDCPSNAIPFPEADDGDKDNNGILDRYEEEDYKPNPYCDLASEEPGPCHDRKDYDEETLLYPCNDGTQKKDWRDCEDVSGYEYPDNDNDKTEVVHETTVFQSASATASSTASTTASEVSSCKLDGSADGILQKFDTAKYQACGLYVNGQKAYSDGFVVGCTQVGNTQLICQALADSSILNTNILVTQTPTQAATQPMQQGIQPAAVSK